MFLRKSKIAFLKGLLLPTFIILAVLQLMRTEGFLLIPMTLESMHSLPLIYYSCVILIICISYMIFGFALNFIRLPLELNVDFKNKAVTSGDNKVIVSNFIKTKVVSFSRNSNTYVIDFYSLDQRKFLIQAMYKSDLDIQELINKHSEDGVEYFNPFQYSIFNFWK
ncbi:hypothetical protein CWE13_10425 [Aliidiomarina shirensis]|uniref:Transmembrane protein n=1 Tax=Aliidiomarina shirensis TaxID=1048642 RepID=A0A432WQ85_9GAMM|nr:hypothetical protein CWE13_10425 [Aliidiomarina shirensis]